MITQPLKDFLNIFQVIDNGLASETGLTIENYFSCLIFHKLFDTGDTFDDT